MNFTSILLKMLLTSSVIFTAQPEAQASAPQVKSQAPGFYRTMIGDIEVTTLLDGFFPMKPKELLPNLSAKTKSLLEKSHQGDTIPTSVDGFLINTGAKLILIDSGSGSFFGPGFGHLIANLKASGYTPAQVDEVEITHMHTDHLGGILLEGKAAFPNAVLRMDQKEADYWLNPENAKTANAKLKEHFKDAATAVEPYRANGKLKPFSGKTEITGGITAMPAYGHTPGHTAYAIESKGQKLLLVGDLFHIEAVQFPDPTVSLIFDSDEKTASSIRKSIFAQAVTEGFLIGAAHLPFPGIGHVLKEGKDSYRYLPIPYAPVE